MVPPFIVVNDRFLAQKKSAAGLLTLATDFCLNVVYKIFVRVDRRIRSPRVCFSSAMRLF